MMRSVRASAGDGTPQVAFYDRGVGTGNPLDRFVGGAFGRGLVENVQDGYSFLANNYERGDEIYIFGFSRAPTPPAAWPASSAIAASSPRPSWIACR